MDHDRSLEAEIGADRVLMLRQVPTEARPAMEALWRVDAAMGDVVARSTQPALGAVKLAWWRDRLEQLDRGLVPAEPRLNAAAEHLLPNGVSGAELASLVEGWAVLLDEDLASGPVADRGSRLFQLAARLLGVEDDVIGDAGALYALVSVGRRGLPRLVGEADSVSQQIGRHRFPRALRPLTALARLAERDRRKGPPFEPEGTPPRFAAMLRHRWNGIVARGD